MASRYVTVFSGPAMAHQLVLAEVGVVAAGYGALVGLYPCVSPHVVISVTDHRKLFQAHRATIRLSFSVLPIVDLQDMK